MSSSHKLAGTVVGALLAATLSFGDARAAGPSAAFADGNAAWEHGRMRDAAALYERSLEDGGLGPTDVVVAYVRIGSARASFGKKDAALSAFRIAVTIDPNFQLPADAGPKAHGPFDQARREAQRRGTRLTLTVTSPDRAEPGTGFAVKVQVADEFAPLLDQFGIEVKDTLNSANSWSTTKPVESGSVQFDVPSKVTQSGSTLLVRVSGLDAHANQWVAQEQRVGVGDAPAAGGGIVAAGGGIGRAGTPAPSGTTDRTSSGGFWSSPWPYVIGGVLLAGGVGAYFLTRPADQVQVGAPTWSGK